MFLVLSPSAFLAVCFMWLYDTRTSKRNHPQGAGLPVTPRALPTTLPAEERTAIRTRSQLSHKVTRTAETEHGAGGCMFAMTAWGYGGASAT